MEIFFDESLAYTGFIMLVQAERFVAYLSAIGLI